MPLFLATWPEPVPVPSLKACSAPGLAWRLVSNFFHKHCFGGLLEDELQLIFIDLYVLIYIYIYQDGRIAWQVGGM